MLWAALNELSPRNRLRLLVLTYSPIFLTYSPVFCWRSDKPLPGAGPVAVQGFLLLPHVTCEIPATCYVFVMDALPTGNCSFWCSVWCLCFTSGPYLLIYFMTSLPIQIFSHSKFSLLPTSPVWFALSSPASGFWVMGNEQALVECLLFQAACIYSFKAIQCLLWVLCIVQTQYVQTSSFANRAPSITSLIQSAWEGVMRLRLFAVYFRFVGWAE